MDEVFLRFPHLSRQIFEILEGQDLSKCVQVSRTWNKFITEENLQTLDIILRYTSCSKAKLRQVLKKTDLETLLIHVNEDYKDDGLFFYPPGHILLFRRRENGGRMTPFHTAAANGHHALCELIIENAEDKNPKSLFKNKPNDGYDLTPLHMAANNGHFEVCELIMDMVENKNPKAGVALEEMTAFDMADKQGHKNVSWLIKSAIGH